jgi:hypothetical protein
VKEEQMRKKKNKKDNPQAQAAPSPDQAEFTGPRGYQEPTK